MNWFQKRWRKFYNTFISLQGPPEKIARSFTAGFWIAWWPIIGTHSLLSLAAGFIFRLNLPAIYLGSWICNPLTIPFILLADYELGSYYVGGADLQNVHFSALPFREMLTLGWNILFPMIVGGIILGTASALLGYFPIKWSVRRVRKKGAQPLPLESDR